MKRFLYSGNVSFGNRANQVGYGLSRKCSKPTRALQKRSSRVLRRFPAMRFISAPSLRFARQRERYVSTSNVKQLLFQFSISGAILPDKIDRMWVSQFDSFDRLIRSQTRILSLRGYLAQ